MGSYFIDMDAVRARYEKNKTRYDKMAQSLADSLNMTDSEILARQYHVYGVDNDFDLVEAMYNEDRYSTGNLLGDPWFNELRIKCAMNPEYTEKCLNSPAFWDVKDEILRRLDYAQQ